MSEILPAVRTALDAVKLGDEDSGARALAERYATLLDAAEPTQQYGAWIAKVDRVLDNALTESTAHQQAREAWTRIRNALAEHSVASDLGPKLLDALGKLGATVAARGDAKPAGGTVIPMENPLQAARDAVRAARDRQAGAS
jgi:uncharacterized membrane-anchored protein YjiN (DUF445 family)